MATDKKTQRKLNRQRRLNLLFHHTSLVEEYCGACPFQSPAASAGCATCPVNRKIQDIGNQLNHLSAVSFVMPEELTWSSYTLLKEREWTKKEIAVHYGIPILQLNDFIYSHTHKNTDEENDVMETKVEKPLNGLTVELYKELMEAGKTDKEVKEQHDISDYRLSSWKKRNGIPDTKLKGTRKAKANTSASADKIKKLKQQNATLTQALAEKEAHLQEAIQRCAEQSQYFTDTFSKSSEQIESLAEMNAKLEKTVLELRAEKQSLSIQLEQSEPVQAVAEAVQSVAVSNEDDQLFEYLLLKRLTEANEKLVYINKQSRGGLQNVGNR